MKPNLMIAFEFQTQILGPEDLNDESGNKKYFVEVDLFSETGSLFDTSFKNFIEEIDGDQTRLRVHMKLKEEQMEEITADKGYVKIICPKLRMVSVVIQNQHEDVIYDESFEPPEGELDLSKLESQISESLRRDLTTHTYQNRPSDTHH